jgi:hypothetical protein
VTKTADSPRCPNKELPAAEGARCRQKKTENTGARRRAPNSPCPKTLGAQCQRPTLKSNFEASGYPVRAKYLLIAAGRERIHMQRLGILFDITQRVSLSASSRRSRSSSMPRVTGNSLMYRPISTLTGRPTLFCFLGLPPSPNTLL